MTDVQPQTLTGVWDGVFSYPRRHPPTNFTAILFESGASVSGTTQENPTEGPHAGLALSALIEGVRAESSLQFTKVYDAVDGKQRKPIEYVGHIKAECTEIEGRWTIAGSWSGTFRMTKAPRAAEVKTNEARMSEPVA